MPQFREKNSPYNEGVYGCSIYSIGGDKMNETKEILMKRYEKVEEIINLIDKDTDNPHYKALLEEQDKLRNEMIELDKIQSDAEMKKVQIEAENKREKKRNLITIGTFTITTVISVWTVCKSFKFDESSTLTSTLGRGSVTSVLPKIFKR